MTTFNAALARARDRNRPPFERWQSLTGCVDRFAPYGYHATLHRLTGGADVPATTWIEHGGLDSALEDLATARRIVLEYADAYTAKRRSEKASGRRSPSPPKLLAGDWQWRDLAYCPIPHRHPVEPLSIVVDRIAAALLAGTADGDVCLVCSTARSLERPCPQCGVLGPGLSRAYGMTHRDA